jgi:AraC-like DNA-binding protein
MAYWNDVVCKHLVPAASHPSNPGNFHGHFTAKSLAGLEVCEMSSPDHFWDRDAKCLRSGPNEDFILSVMVSGTGRLEQAGRQVLQRPGDIVLYDAARPFKYQLAPESVVLLKIPREELSYRVPGAEFCTALRLAEGHSLVPVFANMVQAAMQINLSDGMQAAQTQFASSLLEMLSVIVQLQIGACTDRQRHSELLKKTKDYIDANLSDSTITVEAIAASQNVSARTLARIFAADGTTPMHWLGQRRLQLSYCTLKEGLARQVTDVAFRYGFNDVSHFSRVFKKTYGITPSALLRGSGAG